LVVFIVASGKVQGEICGYRAWTRRASFDMTKHGDATGDNGLVNEMSDRK
jgi:hypothetical protein